MKQQPPHLPYTTSHERAHEALHRHPPRGQGQLDRRSLLALGSLLGLGMAGCGGGGGDAASSGPRAGVVTTLAGTGDTGSADGTGTAASFNSPRGLAVDSSGTLYVADTMNHVIRKVTAAGVVSTLAGTAGVQGSSNGTGAAATFMFPQDLALDASGTLYVADANNHQIRKITPAGVVTTLAGSVVSGSSNGTGAEASFYFPYGLALDAAGNLYVADNGNRLIRKITPAGVVSTLAGSGTAGNANGTGSAASFNNPNGLAVDAAGNVYVADFANHLVRKITPAGVVTTFAGSGVAGSANGTGSAASFNGPLALDVDASGNLYVADARNYQIRKISPSGEVSSLAGSGTSGRADGTGSAASIGFTFGLAASAGGTLYVSDASYHLIRKIT